MLRLTAALFALFAAGACGDIVKSQTTDAGADLDAEITDAMPPGPCERDEIDLEDLFSCYIEGVCGWITTCEEQAVTQEQCEELFGSNVQSGLQGILYAMEADKITYDAQAAARCIRSLDPPICNGEDFGGGEDCELLFVGTVADGEGCFTSEECASIEAYCDDGDGCGEQCCQGVCVAPAGLDEDCEMVGCQDDLHCVEDGGTFTCREGTEGTTCDSDGQCDDELYCDLQKTECVPDHGVHVPCVSDSQCAWPLRCVGESEGLGTCVYTDQLGAPCDSSCSGPYFCRFDGNPVGTCDARLENSSACDDDEQCQSRFCTMEGQCGARPKLGMNCAPNECEVGLLCSSELPDGPVMGKCVERREIDQSCADESHCVSGVCGAAQICEAVEDCY